MTQAAGQFQAQDDLAARTAWRFDGFDEAGLDSLNAHFRASFHAANLWEANRYLKRVRP